MPCFDKKLESSRADFADPETGVKDVDLVITTVELEQMMLEKEFRMERNENELEPKKFIRPLDHILTGEI